MLRRMRHACASRRMLAAKETEMKTLRLVFAALLALMAVAACSSDSGTDASGRASASRDNRSTVDSGSMRGGY